MKLDLSTPIPASLRLNGLLEAAGVLSIEQGVLRFSRASGPSGWMAPREGVTIPLDSIAHIDVGAGLLRLDLRAGRTTFAGQGAVRLGVAMLAQGGSVQPVFAFSGTLTSGLMGAAGELAVGERGLFFAGTGALAESLGKGRWECAWSSVRLVEHKGRKLRIVQRGGEVCFDLDHAAEAARVIAELLPVPVIQSEPEGSVWVGGGVLRTASGGTSPGHAYVDADANLHFVSPLGRTRLGSVDKVLRLDPGAKDRMQAANGEWSLRLDHEDSVIHFDQVAMRVSSPRGGGDERADLRLVVGRRERVRFRDDSGSRTTLSRVWIEDGEREILVYLIEPHGLPALAEAAQLVVPMRSGELRLHTRAAAIDRVDISEVPLVVANLFKGQAEVYRVRLRRPLGRDLHEVRQRGALRMDFALRDVKIMRTDHAPMPAQLADLSITGAAVRVVEPLPIGEVVWLDVDLEELRAPLRAEVLWVRGKAPDQLQLGLRFLDESEKLRARIQRGIYSLQRSQIEVADEERTEQHGVIAEGAVPEAELPTALRPG